MKNNIRKVIFCMGIQAPILIVTKWSIADWQWWVFVLPISTALVVYFFLETQEAFIETMKPLTTKQKEAYDDFHTGTHVFKKVPSLTECAENRKIKTMSFYNRLELIRLKGYLVEFNYCPWCGVKI